MRLATWNVNSLTARMPRVSAWDRGEPARRSLHAGDQTGRRQVPGEGVRQSSATSPRTTATVAGTGSPSSAGSAARSRPAASARRRRRTDVASCRRVRLHPRVLGLRPNGRALDNEFYAVKLAWLARLRSTLDQMCPPGSSVAVCGDFNVAPDDGDVWDPAAFVGATHVTNAERAALCVTSRAGASTTYSGASTTPARSHGGTTGRGTSTRGGACASISCSVSHDLVRAAPRRLPGSRDARKGQKAFRPRAVVRRTSQTAMRRTEFACRWRSGTASDRHTKFIDRDVVRANGFVSDIQRCARRVMTGRSQPDCAGLLRVVAPRVVPSPVAEVPTTAQESTAISRPGTLG